MSLTLELRHLSGSLAGRTQRLSLASGQSISLGRNAGCDVKFHDRADDAVSGLHARLVSEGGRLFVEDLKSSNGTFLGGARCPSGERIVVPDGARLRFAALGPELQVLIDGAVGEVHEAASLTRPSVGKATLKAEIEQAFVRQEGGSRRRLWKALRVLGLVTLLLVLGAVATRFLSLLRPPASPVAFSEPSWAEVEARLRPVVARIESRYRLAARGETVRGNACGSGVLVAPTLVLTTAHLAWPWRDAISWPWDEPGRGAELEASLDSLTVTLPGQLGVPATLFAVSGENGLALLQVTPRPTPTFDLAALGAVPAIAEPVGLFLHPSTSAEAPRPSTLPRRFPQRPTAGDEALFYSLQVAALESDGAGAVRRILLDRALNSCGGGGPLVNRRGELVGLSSGALQATGELSLFGERAVVRSYAAATVSAFTAPQLHAFLSRLGLLPTQARQPRETKP